jgi:hypothetical protein
MSSFNARFESALASPKNLPAAPQMDQLPAPLRAELTEFHRWSTTRWYGQQQEPIAEVTATKYLDHIRHDLQPISTVPISAPALHLLS